MKHSNLIITFALILASVACLWADSTVIAPITWSNPVRVRIDLTPNMPVPIPVIWGTTNFTLTIPEGQKVLIDGTEATGTLEMATGAQQYILTVVDPDRVTVELEERR